MGSKLEIHLLGRFLVGRGGERIPASAWRRRRAADLLTLLALAKGRTLARQTVYDALWPGKDPAAGANNLHRALYDLRRALGGSDVEVDHEAVRLTGDAWVDADAFEAAVRAGGPDRLRDAVALYRGDLSPGAEEAPWLEPHRRRLHALHAEAASAVAAAQALSGPGGDGGLALAVRLLLGQDRLPPLRGREGVVAWLAALLLKGHGMAVLLGAPGAGATRAALEAARLARDLGLEVLCAAATPGAPGLPLDEVQRVVAGRDHPRLLLVDGLHLAAAPEFDRLEALARDGGARRLVIVATCRDDALHEGAPLQALLARLDEARLARGLHVPGLTLAGTRELVADLLGTPPAEPLAQAIHAATDGLPREVEAAVATWRDAGQLPAAPARP